MRNPGSYWICVDPDPPRGTPGTVEHDCYRCEHCDHIVHVKPMCDPADMGGLCKHCGGLVCQGCHGTGTCTPLERRLEAMEERGRFLRDVFGP